MSIDFSQVTDITIPEGSVEKIHETSSGRILWSKNKTLTAHWELITIPNDTINRNYYNQVSFIADSNTENEVYVLTGINPSNYPNVMYSFNKNGTVGNTYALYSGERLNDVDVQEIEALISSDDNELSDNVPDNLRINLRDIDIDPVTKTWCCISNKYYTTNAFSKIKWHEIDTENSSNAILCSWSDKLQKFCIRGNTRAYLVDINGNITDTTSGLPTISISNTPTLIWVDSLSQYVLYPSYRKTNYYTSSDGLTWSSIQNYTINDMPSEAEFSSGADIAITNNICWHSKLGKYIGIAYASSSRIYLCTSENMKKWTYFTSLPNPNSVSAMYSCITYSPDRNITLVCNNKNAYITRDFDEWIEVPYKFSEWGIPNPGNTTRNLISYSKNLGSFIICYPYKSSTNAGYMLRLII